MFLCSFLCGACVSLQALFYVVSVILTRTEGATGALELMKISMKGSIERSCSSSEESRGDDL